MADPKYSNKTIFAYDFGISCPPKFRIEFNLPTSGEDLYARYMNVEIQDGYRTVNLTLLRPAPFDKYDFGALV